MGKKALLLVTLTALLGCICGFVPQTWAAEVCSSLTSNFDEYMNAVDKSTLTEDYYAADNEIKNLVSVTSGTYGDKGSETPGYSRRTTAFYAIQRISAEHGRAKLVNGKFGKEDGDFSLGFTTVSNAADCDMYLRLRPYWDSITQLSNGNYPFEGNKVTYAREGQTCVIDFEMAFEMEAGKDSHVYMTGMAYNSDGIVGSETNSQAAGGDNKFSGYPLKIYKSGKMNVFGDTIELPNEISGGEWHRVHLEITSGSADEGCAYTLYFDRDCVAEDQAFSYRVRERYNQMGDERTAFYGMNQIWFGYTSKKSNSIGDGVYFDSLSFRVQDGRTDTVPVVTISGIGDDIRDIDHVTVEISASSEPAEIERIEVYYDGELVETAEQHSCSFELSAPAAGSHTIRAVAINSKGERGEAVKAFEVSEYAERVSVGITGSADADQLTAMIHAETDRPGADITRMEIYLDGELAGTASGGDYTLTVDNPDCGERRVRAVAESTSGSVGEAEKGFKVGRYVEMVDYQEDFEEWDGGDRAPSNIRIYSQAGSVEKKRIDQEHGVSAALGMYRFAEGESAGAYMNIPVKEIEGKVLLRFEFYLLKSPEGSADPFKISFKQTGGAEEVQLRLYDNQAVAKDNAAVAACTAGQWYTCSIEADLNTHLCDIYLYPSDGETHALVQGAGFTGDITSLDAIRVWGLKTDGADNYIAVDHVRILQKAAVPEITAIGSESGMPEFTAAYDAKVLFADLSKAVIAGSVNTKTVSLSQNGIEVPVSAVSYDSQKYRIYIEPGLPLKSNQTYRITLSEDLRISDALKSGCKISAGFSTTPRNTELEKAEFVYKNGILTAHTSILHSGAAREGILILTVWKDGRFIASKAENLTLAGDMETTLSASAPPGANAEVYLLRDTASGPWPMSDHILRY